MYEKDKTGTYKILFWAYILAMIFIVGLSLKSKSQTFSVASLRTMKGQAIGSFHIRDIHSFGAYTHIYSDNTWKSEDEFDVCTGFTVGASYRPVEGLSLYSGIGAYNKDKHCENSLNNADWEKKSYTAYEVGCICDIRALSVRRFIPSVEFGFTYVGDGNYMIISGIMFSLDLKK
jgi:hypothetical protein